MLLSLLLLSACGPRVSTVKKKKKRKGSAQNVLNSNKPQKQETKHIPKERFVTLNYNGDQNDPAKSCEIMNEVNLSVTTACTCSINVCVVGITGDFGYEGLGNFDYKIISEKKVATPDANIELELGSEESEQPTSMDINSAMPLNDGAENIITLSYAGNGEEIPENCSISNLNHLNITTPCSCGIGYCQVGVTAPGNYSGPASFDYSIETDQGTVTNTATASLNVQQIDDPPVVVATNPSAVNEDSESIITLNYTDNESNPATSCNISNLSNLMVSTACSCNSGLCTVGVTGDSNYNGNGSFDYTVNANGEDSDIGSVNLAINSIDDAPTPVPPASNPSFAEESENILTLAYDDPEGDLATSCQVDNLVQVFVSTPCSCDGAGVCTVGVTGQLNFSGTGGLNYTITAGGETSAPSTINLDITNTPDPPVANDFTPPNLAEDSQSIITLDYSDPDGDLGASCSVTNLSQISISQPCACDGSGVCTVGVTGISNYNGVGSFDYQVNTNGSNSNTGSATLNISSVDDPPVSDPIAPPAVNEDEETIVTLSYSDPENDPATSCAISGESNLSVTTSCACASGICTVGVTGDNNYNGNATFNYTVTSNGETSSSASASITVSSVDDPPVSDPISPPAVNEDEETIVTLSYSDPENDPANSCTISGENNLSVSTACDCSSGICTVGVTGDSNYNGVANFDYTVTANGETSPAASASITVSSVDDPPMSDPISPPAVNEDEETIVTLSYSDPENDPASSCNISNENNLSVTTSCACSSGVCTVGVTGNSNYNGNADFDYTVTANGETSPPASASITVSSVDDPPVSNNITPSSFNQDTESIITLSYSDPEIDLATTCSLSGLINVSETTSCSCNGSGVCTAGVTGSPGYSGSASFNYTVTANGETSNTASSSFTIEANSSDFISIWQTTSSNEDIELPLKAGYSYNFTVDWGDGSPVGTVTSSSDPDKVHTFTNPGQYTITISGLFQTIYLYNHDDRNKLIEVVNLGTVGWTDLKHSFKGAQNLTDFTAGITDTSEVTSMSRMFELAISLENIDLSSFDTSNVTSMGGMFENAVSLTSLDLSSFNTSNVTYMSWMFYGCEEITFLDISSFDTSSVTKMDIMFGNLKKLTTLDLSHFDTSNVTSMIAMLDNLENLTYLDVSSFNTSNVTTMSSLFSRLEKITSLDLSHFDTSQVTSMQGMFSGMDALTSLNISSFDTSKVTKMGSMFSSTALTSLDLSHFDTSKVTTMGSMFSSMHELSYLDISSFNTSNVTHMDWMFMAVISLPSLDLSHFDTSKVDTMASMFGAMYALTSLNISNFDTSNVTSMYSMFRHSNSITSLDLSHFDTSNVINMDNMFNSTSALETLNTMGWDLSLAAGSTQVLTGTNSEINIFCDQGGDPGTGDFFGESCQ
ncbi:BspA family leucine-rich repeat surface protein [Bacteriovoracaceae bacterium]|nr:BspA family leucine-rich repeat surface protein [Bacteriovoracaceae bacterium]